MLFLLQIFLVTFQESVFTLYICIRQNSEPSIVAALGCRHTTKLTECAYRFTVKPSFNKSALEDLVVRAGTRIQYNIPFEGSPKPKVRRSSFFHYQTIPKGSSAIQTVTWPLFSVTCQLINYVDYVSYATKPTYK